MSEHVPEEPTSDDAIRATVARLARPHPRGTVIERAAILAEGELSAAILSWIVAHDGEPETTPATARPRGLHSARTTTAEGPVSRYVLPAGALV